jgi:hypothetical protein
MALAEPLAEILRDITSPRKRPWLLLLIGLFVVSAAWKTKLGAPERPPDTIEYHYAEWKRHLAILHSNRGTPDSRFSLRTVIPFIEEKLSDRERHTKISEHETALIRDGYFAELRFDTAEPIKIISQLYTNTLKTDLEHRWTASTVYYRDRTNVCITARTEDLPKLQSLVKQLTQNR